MLVLASCAGGGSGGEAETRKTVDETVDGVHFTLSLPGSMRPDTENGPGVWIERPGGNDLHVFAVLIDPALVTSLDKAKYQATLRMADARWARAEEKAGGYALTNLSATGEVEATTFVSTPAGWLKCKAIAKQPGRTARALVESICDSLVVK